MKGIVITTSEYSKEWLPECLNSVKDLGYPVLVVGNLYKPELPEGVMFRYNDWNAWELGGILRGAEYFDEFVHLMDTSIVTNPEMIKTMFAHEGGMYLCNAFFSYLGKYVSKHIEAIGVPKISTKEEAVEMERRWNEMYLNQDKQAKQFQPELPVHTDVFEEKHGRRNMVLDNGFIRKYKATWSL